MRGIPLPEEIIIGELEGPQCGPKVHCTPDRESAIRVEERGFEARRRNEKPAVEEISPLPAASSTFSGHSHRRKLQIGNLSTAPGSLASNDIRVGSHFWSSAE